MDDADGFIYLMHEPAVGYKFSEPVNVLALTPFFSHPYKNNKRI